MNLVELKYSKPITAIFVGLLAVIAGLIIPNALKNFFLSDHWGSFLIMIVFGIILIIPLIISLIKKRFDLFEPIFLWVLIYGFLYLAKPFAQLLTTEPFKYGSEFLNKALLLAILGLICFYAGYYGVFGRKIAKKIPVISDSVSSKKLFWIGWFFIIIGFWGLNHYIQISGGWQTFWQKPHGLAGLAIKSTAYIYELPELMVIGFILIYEIFINRIIIEKKAVKIQNILGLIMAAIGGVGIYTIIWGSRTYFSWIIIAAVVLYFLKKQTKPKLKTIIIGIFVLFIVLSLIPIYRQYMYLGSNFSKITSDIKLSKILRVAFNPLDEFSSYLAEVALVPNSIPYGYFHLYAQTLLHPIPRLIWPNKPAFFNPNWDDFLSKSGMGWGAAESMLGDFYAQLGTWGIIICTFLSGILWRTFYEYLRKAPTNRSVILIYAIILPNMFTYVAQSALIGFLKWAPYMVPSTIIALLLSREKKKAETEK